jgi:AmmeMemoRadiSam system protein A
MHPLINLAQTAIKVYLQEKKIISPPADFPSTYLNKKAGVFVSVYKENELRGCVGTYLPTKENIAQETIFNAIAAATQDFRFSPIKLEELNHLSCVIYLLESPRLVLNLKQLNPKKFGIIVKSLSGEKTGLLLPDLEGIETVNQQIFIACQKAGIDHQKERFLIYRFKAKKINQLSNEN